MLNVFIDTYENSVFIRKYLDISCLITAFEVEYDKDFYYPGESHDFWECTCVCSGKVNVTADSNVYLLSQNQLLFHRPNEFHRLWSTGDVSPRLIIFSFKTTTNFHLNNTIYNIDDLQIKQLSTIVSKLHEVFHFRDICIVSAKKNTVLQTQLVINALESLILHVVSGDVIVNAENTSISAHNYMRIIEVMKSNLDKKLSLEELAKKSDMSVSNMKRTFEMYANIGVLKYFNMLKMRKAIELLETGMSVKEVSITLGFLEQNYFSAVFKRFTGVSPSSARQNFEQK